MRTSCTITLRIEKCSGHYILEFLANDRLNNCATRLQFIQVPSSYYRYIVCSARPGIDHLAVE